MDVLMWSLAMVGQTGLTFAGINQLTIISEFEEQKFGPTDFTNQFNEYTPVEHYALIASALLHLALGPRLFGLIVLPLAAYSARILRRRRHLLDVTDCYRLLKRKRREYQYRTAAYGILLVAACGMFLATVAAEIRETSGGEPVNLALHHSLLYHL